ncbi:MAG: TonB-dependent receptor [Bacteroides sp.]|nr:TonB-dependent receptor [Bacteroides sp.]
MKKLFLFLLTVVWATIAVAQTRTVTGVVVYEGDGEPLVGATVLPVGGGQPTATNIDGEFTLKVPANVTNLQISFVGMITRNVPIDFNKPMRIELSNHENALDEVMVVAYGTAKKSAYTGSASVIKAETIENALVTNATNALNGKVAGVQIQSSNGQPGTSPTVRIRGVGSINANSDPLYVVDGVPYQGGISEINSMDIESMTVLKDAAAAALYGARGANGVILITTKSGQAGDTKIAFDMRWGVNSRLVPNQDVFTNTDEYVEMVYRSLYNGYYYNQSMSPAAAHAAANANIFPSLGYQVYTVPTGEGLIGENGKINPNAKLGYQEGNFYYTPDDWTKEQLRNGLRQEYNVSVTGGTDRVKYYVSASYLGDQGLIQGSHFRRLSARTSLDFQAKKWLKLGTNMSYTYTNSGYPGDQTATASSGNAFMMGNNLAPYYPMYVRDAAGSIVISDKTGKKVYDYGDGQSTPYTRNWMSISNPAGDLVLNTTDYLDDVFNGKWYANLTPIDGLTATGSVGYYVCTDRYHDLGNPYYGQSASYKGSAYQMFRRTRSINLQGLINYRKTFADLHDIDILLGYESYDMNIEDLEGAGYNLYKPDSWVMNNTIDQKMPYGYTDNYATRGLFFRVNYSFANRYFFSVSGRRDGSSRFAKNHRWGNFYSVSAAWDVAQENFMADQQVFDQLKLKASFGQQGNDNIGNYYAWTDQYRATGADGVWSDGTLSYKGNPDLTWETSNNFNIGIDFSILKGGLFGTVEYFNRQTSDMLYYKPVSPSLGYSSIPMNIGSMRNNGWEIELTWRPVSTRNITWDINGNISFVSNKVLKLHPDLNGQYLNGTTMYREGGSMYERYLVQYAGVDPATGLALYWDANPVTDAEGNIVKDQYGQPLVEEYFLSTDASHAYSYARKRTGNLMPKAYGGFGTNLSVYGFDISASFAFQFGGKILDNSYQAFMFNGSGSMGQNWHKDQLKAWTPENPYTDVPRLDNLDSYSNYGSSDRWLTSSNYLSLQNVTVGYTLPNKIVKKMYLSNLRIYAAGENLFLLTARKGLDPRQSYTSSNGATYGASRSISGGVRVEF